MVTGKRKKVKESDEKIIKNRLELDKFQTIAKAEDTRFELATPERGASFPMRLLAIRLSSNGV